MRLPWRQREERAAAVVEHVRVHVPEPRDQVLAGGVDHARSWLDAHLTGSADLGDPFTGPDDGPVAQRGSAAGIHHGHVRKGYALRPVWGRTPNADQNGAAASNEIRNGLVMGPPGSVTIPRSTLAWSNALGRMVVAPSISRPPHLRILRAKEFIGDTTDSRVLPQRISRRGVHAITFSPVNSSLDCHSSAMPADSSDRLLAPTEQRVAPGPCWRAAHRPPLRENHEGDVSGS